MFAQQNQRAQTSTGSSGGLLQKVNATTDQPTVGRCHGWTDISTYRHSPALGKMCMQQFCILCRGEEVQNKCDTLQCRIWDLIWWGVMQEGVAANANFMRPILAQVLLFSSCCCLIIIHSDGFAPMPPTKSVLMRRLQILEAKRTNLALILFWLIMMDGLIMDHPAWPDWAPISTFHLEQL